MMSLQKQRRVEEICEIHGLDYSNPDHKQTIELILQDEFPLEVDTVQETEEYTTTEETSDNEEYPLYPIAFALLTVFGLAIAYVDGAVKEPQFWTTFKYTYLYCYSSTLTVYFLSCLNKKQEPVDAFFKCAFWSLFIAVPIFFVVFAFVIWILFPQYLFILVILMILGVAKLFGINLFSGGALLSAFNSDSSSSTSQNYSSSPRDYKPKASVNNPTKPPKRKSGVMKLQRFQGSNWIDVERSSGSSAYLSLSRREEIEKKGDMYNKRTRKYRIVDEDGNSQD
jgi:hypothetical protein